MKELFQYLVLTLLLCVFLPKTSQGVSPVGNDNPTGVTGEYNGSITTGGSYDPYTGNGKRVVDDLTVTGSIGAYPLKWTRTLNTRGGSGPFGDGGGWMHSYQWGLTVYETPPTCPPPCECDGPAGTVYYPDGRRMNLRQEGPHTFVQADGIEPMGDRVVYVGGNDYDLRLKDGGRVEFRTVNGASRIAKNIVDPSGQITTLAYDTFRRLEKITEPGGRYLQISYHTYPGEPPAFPSPVDVIEYVRSYDGSQGHLIETVHYDYARENATGGVLYARFYNLIHANYDDNNGPQATYSYYPAGLVNPGNRWTLAPGEVKTCDDVRYAGAMKRIEYEYVPTSQGQAGLFARGQVAAEKNMTTHQDVSRLTYQSGLFSRTETRPDGATRLFQYIDNGELGSYTDFAYPNGIHHSTTITYEFDVTPDGHYRRNVTDALLHTTKTEKERNIGAVMAVIHPNQSRVEYTYSDLDNPYYVASRTDENHKTTTYTRNQNTHQVERIDYPDGGWEEFSYNPLGQVLTHKRTNGVYIAYDHFEYDGRGRLLKRWDPTPAAQYPPSSEVPYSSFTYYESGPSTDRVYRAYDQLNHWTEYQYDGRGNVTRLTHQDNTYTQSHYNPDGTLDWTADENHPGADTDVNQRTRYVYDEYKRVTTVTNPMGEVATNSYDPGTNPSVDRSLTHTTSSVYRTTSPMLKKTEHQYDANFRRTQTTEAAGTADAASTNFTYDEVGNLHTTEDPRHNFTTFGYDDRNRRTTITNNTPPETTTLVYDDAGNKTKEIRQDTSFRTWDYDAMNRLWHACDWHLEGQPAPTTIYFHDIAGNVRTITDAKGAIYGYDYDLKNLKTSQTYPLDATNTPRSEGYAYDAVGNLVYSIKHPSEQQKQIHYDTRNRPDHSWHYGGGVVGPDIVTGYDAASRVTSIVTNGGETTIGFGYDEANRKIWEDQTVAAPPGLPTTTRRVESHLDADGKRYNLDIAESGMAPEGDMPAMATPTGAYSVDYQYTDRNQVKKISGESWAINYTYDANGNMTTREVQNGANSSSTHCPTENYDALNRPTTWEQTGSNGFHALSHYQYDQMNREVATWRDHDSSRGERFTYEPTNQLSHIDYNAQNAWTLNPTGADRTVSYAYASDKLNRSSMTDNGQVTTYAPDPLNQYTAVGGMSYQYDSNFNLTYTGAFSGVYDAANRLVSASNGGSGEAQQTVAGFVYDGLGRCVKRTLNGVATIFVYDGWKPIGEWDAWGYFQAWNVYGPGDDEILLRHWGKYGYLRFQLDRHGNVEFLLNNNGALLEKYKYDAFGKPAITDAADNPRSFSYYGHCFLFQGREYIWQLGIYDYRNRFYHPATGRFLQTDPTGFGAGDMNLFRYVNDDPIDGSDPTGLVSRMNHSGDFMWDFASYWDAANTSQGSFADYTHNAYSGGGPGNDNAKYYGAIGGFTHTLRPDTKNIGVQEIGQAAFADGREAGVETAKDFRSDIRGRYNIEHASSEYPEGNHLGKEGPVPGGNSRYSPHADLPVREDGTHRVIGSHGHGIQSEKGFAGHDINVANGRKGTPFVASLGLAADRGHRVIIYVPTGGGHGLYFNSIDGRNFYSGQ
jgi:RHS repeat-associated protein